MEWIGPLISGMAVILVAIIEAAAARDRKQMKEDRERTDRRAAVRAEESRLSMELMSATCALSLVMAKKMNGLHTNGDVEEAMRKAGEAQGDYSDFVREVAAKQVVKQ